MTKGNHAIQVLPNGGPAREALRAKGQFWTPDWVTKAMAAYVLLGETDHIFDPAVGAGAFFRAAKTVAHELGINIKLLGTEIDPHALREAKQNGSSELNLSHVQITDFVLHPPTGPFKAIVANPPYIRHHRLSDSVKARLKEFGTSLIGRPLDGRAGFHVYFLLRALQLLEKNGRLAFIMPADTCEGVFAPTLWRWITKQFSLEAVVTFAPQASPFPKVDTNTVIFMIKNAEPQDHFLWAKCHLAQTEHLKLWVLSGFKKAPNNEPSIYRRELSEGLITGFSREPSAIKNDGSILADFAKVMRGIATGANDFFLFTAKQVAALGIPRDYLLPTIARTRDVQGEVIDRETLRTLEEKGRPTLLLSLDDRPIDQFPNAIRHHLRQGESSGIHKKTLISTRSPWYKMETRSAPPFLFAYLGRRNSRFIRNMAGVVPLTGFLCVYPRQRDPVFVQRLWEVLRHPTTTANLALVGKSYGSGAIKVEPRALEKLPLPKELVLRAGLLIPEKHRQLKLFRLPEEAETFTYAREGSHNESEKKFIHRPLAALYRAKRLVRKRNKTLR